MKNNTGMNVDVGLVVRTVCVYKSLIIEILFFYSNLKYTSILRLKKINNGTKFSVAFDADFNVFGQMR